MAKVFGSSLTRYILIELIGDLLYWPVWWYSRGLRKVAEFCWQSIAGKQRELGIAIWIKNIFVPMFGQYDWEGRLISFFARLVIICSRSVVWIFWSLLVSTVLVGWILLPFAIYYQLIEHFRTVFPLPWL